MSKPAYQPSAAVLHALHGVDLVAVVGPSGSGKTTLIRLALERDPSLHVVVSDISRPSRPEEKDGVDYYFRSKQAMLDAIKRREYVQIAPSNSGDIYATHVENYATNGPSILTVWADAMPVFRALPFRSLRTIFIVPASYEAWLSHLGLHNFTPELRAKRLAEARRSLQFALDDTKTELLINDDLEQATTDFLHAVYRPITESLPAHQPARVLITTLLERLSADLP